MTFDEVVSDVIGPALGTVLRPGEVTRVVVDREADTGGRPTDFFVRVTVTACGEEFVAFAYQSAADYSSLSPRDHLVSELVDFVAESRFGWGEDRSASGASDS